jgi:3D (Asp-Asp-Asp) domain-containing protein
LTETAPFFFRILDPLIERLISALIQADPDVKDRKLVLYTQAYNVEIVHDTIKKLM